ncbi:TFIIIC subunit-domain-containing protein [Aspergillus aurantiobrunneus]
MSVLDPAMLNSHPDDEDSDWEYEYHDTETETFFLNLDLTTHHGPIRAPRRRNDPSVSTSTSTATTANPTPAPSRPDDQDPVIINSENDTMATERFQILGLHTRNPIISYQNQVFSGSWADQIGTELFFTRPDTAGSEFDGPDSTSSQIAPLKHTDDFDLISANSVKILGRKANLISSSGPAVAPGQRESFSSDPISGLYTQRLVYKPEHQSNQTRFLDRLKELKSRKGDTDTVRTVFSTAKRGPDLENRLRGWVRTEEQLVMIQHLNERAVHGDYNAVRDLENIYAQLGTQHAGPSEGPSRSVGGVPRTSDIPHSSP